MRRLDQKDPIPFRLNKDEVGFDVGVRGGDDYISKSSFGKYTYCDERLTIIIANQETIYSILP